MAEHDVCDRRSAPTGDRHSSIAIRRSSTSGCTAGVALIPAAVVLLNGDQLYLKHFLLSESVFTVLIAGALYCTVRYRENVKLKWLLGIGTLVSLASTFRTVGIFLIPAFLIAVLFAAPRGVRSRAVAVGVVGASAAALLLGYVGAQVQVTGEKGLSRTGGWASYARTAQVADCRKFTPPPGTAALCEAKAPSDRNGANFYFHGKTSPARMAFGRPPKGDAKLGSSDEPLF